jgi:hypothetical protein
MRTDMKFTTAILISIFMLTAYFLNTPQTPTFHHKNPNSTCDVTMVTSYFKIKSKHSAEEYNTWMKSVLSLDACMVINTENASVFWGRNPHYTLINEAGLQSLYLRFNRSIEFWERQHLIDPEREVHRGYELYWIWALKPLFLRDAITNNTFGSRYFFWVDIGCLRDTKYTGRSLHTVPVKVTTKDGVFFSLVRDFTWQELMLTPNGTSPLTWLPDRLSGAVWGGGAEAVLRFVDAYFTVFNRLADAGHFVGKDQTIMNLACIENAPHLCVMVTPRWFVYNVFFYMIPFLLGDTYDWPYFLGTKFIGF